MTRGLGKINGYHKGKIGGRALRYTSPSNSWIPSLVQTVAGKIDRERPGRVVVPGRLLLFLGGLAQLARASALQAEGQGFESLSLQTRFRWIPDVRDLLKKVDLLSSSVILVTGVCRFWCTWRRSNV